MGNQIATLEQPPSDELEKIQKEVKEIQFPLGDFSNNCPFRLSTPGCEDIKADFWQLLDKLYISSTQNSSHIIIDFIDGVGELGDCNAVGDELDRRVACLKREFSPLRKPDSAPDPKFREAWPTLDEISQIRMRVARIRFPKLLSRDHLTTRDCENIHARITPSQTLYFGEDEKLKDMGVIFDDESGVPTLVWNMLRTEELDRVTTCLEKEFGFDHDKKE
jgi:hypothetical protein